jgi:hypothetical protein
MPPRKSSRKRKASKQARQADILPSSEEEVGTARSGFSNDGEQLKTAPNAAASETQAGNSLRSASEISSSVISASEQKNRRCAQFEKRHKTAQHTHAEVLGKFDLFLDCFLPQLTTRVYL